MRQMLAQSRVRVGGRVCKIATTPIRSGETIEISSRKIPASPGAGLEILHQDPDIVVVQKPAGLLTVATPDERRETAYRYLRDYLAESDPRKKLFIVHRIDRFASGILVFARSEKAQTALKDLFSRHEVRRNYWAIVEGHVEKDSGTIRSRLAENKALRMYSTRDAGLGKIAVTHFRVLRRTGRFTTLEVTLETGRKNQIRVHLSEAGHPIVGDRAYGSTVDPLGRLGLHAFRLGFNHPVSRVPLLFETQPPQEFRDYL